MKTLEKTLNETLNETLQMINTYAANPLGDSRYIEDLPVGSHTRQGDLYFVRIDAVPECAVIVADRQLAPGHSQGSRHTVMGTANVYAPNNFGTIERIEQDIDGKRVTGFRSVGHVVEFLDRDRADHVEHAGHSLPAGVYQVYHQTDPLTAKRVQD